jgi:hypothetical protein
MPPAVMVKTHHHRIKCHTVSDEQFITIESNDVPVAAQPKLRPCAKLIMGASRLSKTAIINNI